EDTAVVELFFPPDSVQLEAAQRGVVERVGDVKDSRIAIHQNGFASGGAAAGAAPQAIGGIVGIVTIRPLPRGNLALIGAADVVNRARPANALRGHVAKVSA